jgi:electron transport complex protein RnfB
MFPFIDTAYFQIPAFTVLAVGIIWLTLISLRYLKTESNKQQLSLIDQINALLPQTQCGHCGHPGCLPYARAITNGAAINQCPPGGKHTIQALSVLLNEANEALNPRHGEHTGPLVAVIREAECIGCTKCIQACPIDAILGGTKLMHTVIESECNGCDLCLEPCPVDCIDLLPNSGNQLRPRPLPMHIDASEHNIGAKL